MKNYEEMARNVLAARDEHNRIVQIRQAKIKRYVPVVSSFCFAVLLGLGVWHHMSDLPRIPTQTGTIEETTGKIEIRPPQETQTTTVIQAETRIETIAQVTIESLGTEKQTEPTTKMQEPTETLPEVIASDTTAVQTSAMTTAEVTSKQIGPATTVQTIAVTTTVQTVPVSTTIPTVPTYEGHNQTLPPAETTQPAEIVTTTQQTTQLVEIVTETRQTTKPLSTRETVIMTSPDPLPGFQISEPDPNNCLEITFKTPVNPSPKQEVKYALQMDTYQAQEFYSGPESETAYTYKVTIGDQQETTSILISVQPRTNFTIRYYASDTLLPVDVSGFPGVYVLTKESCFLYWDDGLYTIKASGPLEDRDTILEIARHFKSREIDETETKLTEPNS